MTSPPSLTFLPALTLPGEDGPAEDCANAILDKTTKSDDAAVPKYLRKEKIVKALGQEWGNQPEPHLIFSKQGDLLHLKWALRKPWVFYLMMWKQKLCRDFTKCWFHLHGKAITNPRQIKWDNLQACAKADGCSWWMWGKGSAIFFWPWPLDYQEIA
eukprot:jgi/Psemu1/27910/gm1.27910_g